MHTLYLAQRSGFKVQVSAFRFQAFIFEPRVPGFGFALWVQLLPTPTPHTMKGGDHKPKTLKGENPKTGGRYPSIADWTRCDTPS